MTKEKIHELIHDNVVYDFENEIGIAATEIHKLHEEELEAAFNFAFAEGIVFGMNTNYNHKSFADWLKEINENRLV